MSPVRGLPGPSTTFMLFTLVKAIAGAVVWRTREKQVQLLLKFARTEAGGALDIARAAQSVKDEDLRKHLLHHVADEERHAAMFRRRAREVHGAGSGADPAPETTGSDLVPTLAASARGSLSLTDHGFLPSDNFAALGEVRYIAMLHLAEVQAAADFRLHRRLTARIDRATAAVFTEILRDEEYHVAYTRAQLKKWEKEGRQAEVRKALRAMRWLRFKTLWVQLSQRLGSVLGTLMLSALYLTVFLPFGLIARCMRRPRGWVRSQRQPARTVDALRLQS
jgi:rubrerythrin